VIRTFRIGFLIGKEKETEDMRCREKGNTLSSKEICGRGDITRLVSRNLLTKSGRLL
jgi:hypothetical protein